jgi:hypothetical protein
MRAVPLLRVEVDGTIITRPGVLDVMLCDRTGKPSVVHLRPELQPGEVLVERAGSIPAIIKEQPCKA